MKQTIFRKIFALICAAALLLCTTSALAKTVEPEKTILPDPLGELYMSATVKTYDVAHQCFPVVLLERDHYSEADVASLQVGDTLVVSDAEHTVSEIGSDEYGILELKFADGLDILMDAQQDGSFVAMLAENEQYCLHVVGEGNLKAAAGIVLTDLSDLDAAEDITYEGLDVILPLQARREADGMGFDGSYTTISLNESGEIAEIRIFHASWLD